jgi:hypothetical protein
MQGRKEEVFLISSSRLGVRFLADSPNSGGSDNE